MSALAIAPRSSSTDMRADARNLLNQQAKEVAIFARGEAIQRGAVFAIDRVDEQAALFADSRHLLRRGDRNLNIVADAACFDDDEQGSGFEDNTFYAGDQIRCELRLID